MPKVACTNGRLNTVRVRLRKNVQSHESYSFTCVRNPYTRILSSFFDKICGIQRNGKRYRGNLVPLLIQKYGIEVGGDDGKQEFDQIQSFRRFLLFARDTIRFRRPMDPDIHWSAMSGHVSTFIVNGGQYDKIIWTEKFNEGMADVLSNIKTPHAVDLEAIPRFNESEGHGPNVRIQSKITLTICRCTWSMKYLSVISKCSNMISKTHQTRCRLLKSI